MLPIHSYTSKYYQAAMELSDSIWANPEAANQEFFAFQYYRKLLEKEGFHFRTIPTLPTAFVAEAGEGSPVIAVLAEYDALPGLSQQVIPFRTPVNSGDSGHGCGHNLLGAAAFCAALAIRDFLFTHSLSGTIRLYGCPAEETMSGKRAMLDAGLFEGCDAALSWHPFSFNAVHDQAYYASTSLKFHFSGKSAHAGDSPELGRSALDAVELMNVGANYLREHIAKTNSLHYTTYSGDFSPNIVPSDAWSWYYVRSSKYDELLRVTERLENIAKGAALMTDTSLRIERLGGCMEYRPNHTLTALNRQIFEEAVLPVYSDEEIQFALALRNTIHPDACAKAYKKLHVSLQEDITGMHRNVVPTEHLAEVFMRGSSDSGDVSHLIPMQVFTTACWPICCTPHTWQVTAASGSTLGKKGMLFAADLLGEMAMRLFCNPELVQQAKDEFLPA